MTQNCYQSFLSLRMKCSNVNSAVSYAHLTALLTNATFAQL